MTCDSSTNKREIALRDTHTDLAIFPRTTCPGACLPRLKYITFSVLGCTSLGEAQQLGVEPEGVACAGDGDLIQGDCITPGFLIPLVSLRVYTLQPQTGTYACQIILYSQPSCPSTLTQSGTIANVPYGIGTCAAIPLTTKSFRLVCSKIG